MGIFTQIKAIFLSIFLLCCVLLPAGLIALFFPMRRRLKIICPVWEFCGRILMKYACRVKMHIDDMRPQDFKTVPQQGLYIVNHQSFMDIPALIHITQSAPIMKKEIMYFPIFGWLGWISGAMPVSRSSMKSRRKVFDQAKKRILRDKLGLQVYPEGTRSKTGDPKSYEEIKRTLLVFAFAEKIPVIPVSIYGTHAILNKSGWINTGKNVGVKAHEVMYPKDYANSDEFGRAVWAKVIEGHTEFKNRFALQTEKES